MNLTDNVIYTLQRYYYFKNCFPKISWMRQKLGVTNSKLIQALRTLEHLGLLIRNHNQYKVTRKLLEYKINQPLSKKLEDKKTFRFQDDDIQVSIIRIVMAVIGIGSVIMSCYFSVRWLLEYLSVFWANTLGIVMVLFSAFALEVIILLNKNKQNLIIGVFIFVWIIVLFFSMISTVAVLYDQLVTDEKIEIESNTKNIFKNLEWEEYNIIEDELINMIENKERELIVVNKLLDQFDDLAIREEKEKEWLSSLTTKRKAEEQIEKWRMELKQVREKKLAFLQENEEEVGIIDEAIAESTSFYVWIGEIFEADPNRVQFVISVFPAVFIDVIAPIALAVAMFLRRKEEKNGKMSGL